MRYAGEFSFARCNDAAGAIILHDSAASNTSRTGRSTSPAAQSKEPKVFAKLRIFRIENRKISVCFTQHAPDGMVDVKSRECTTQGCCKWPNFGVAGTGLTEYCVQHARDGIANVFRNKCRTECCGKCASFGVAGAKTVEYCVQAPDRLTPTGTQSISNNV